MRTNIILILYLMLFLRFPGTAQQRQTPITITPMIGDTLHQSDRGFYQLLPKLQGFRRAVFYLNPDSSLRVQAELDREGRTVDTVIGRYSKLSSFRNHIAAVDLLKGQAGDGHAVDKYFLKDGSVVQGRTVKLVGDTVTVATAHLGTISILKAEIARIEFVESSGNERYEPNGPVVDPNQTRTFLLPTATTLPSGGGYVADYEVALFTIAIAAGDRLMLNGGFLLWPLPLEEQVLNFGLKLKLVDYDINCFAIGAQFLTIPGRDAHTYGIGYGVFSRGDANRKFSIAAGSGFDVQTGSGASVCFAISGDSRVSESVKLLFEAYYLGSFDTIPLIVGIRFFGNHVSGDIGLLFPIGSDFLELGTPIGFPVVNFVYSF